MSDKKVVVEWEGARHRNKLQVIQRKSMNQMRKVNLSKMKHCCCGEKESGELQREKARIKEERKDKMKTVEKETRRGGQN